MTIDVRLAEPIDIIEAWCGGVMNAPEPRKHAQYLVQTWPVPENVDDPIFYTPHDGTHTWHRARDITNPNAMRDLKEYLHRQGLSLPRELGMAWAGNLERQQWASDVRKEVQTAIAYVFEHEGVTSAEHLRTSVLRVLNAKEGHGPAATD